MQHNFPILDDTGQVGSSMVSSWCESCLEHILSSRHGLRLGRTVCSLSKLLQCSVASEMSGTAALQWTRKLSQGRGQAIATTPGSCWCCIPVEVTKAMAHSRTTAEPGTQSAAAGPWASIQQLSEEEQLPGAARI